MGSKRQEREIVRLLILDKTDESAALALLMNCAKIFLVTPLPLDWNSAWKIIGGWNFSLAGDG